ncbi:MAG: molybdopterin cofactor-binding domain-containing protein [Paracoccaceae bacterium]
MTLNTSRRGFLTGAAATAGALIVGVDAKGVWAQASAVFMPNPFVKVSPDGIVTVILKHYEMGQGVTTGLATLVAEEMDADWAKVAVEFAPADVSKYANLIFGAQTTGGSTAIANSYMQYREAGSVARQLLVAAAAAQWGVPAGEITVADSMIKHGERTAGFGEMVPHVPVGLEIAPAVKDPATFTLIGRDKLARKDTSGKVNGSAIFAMDVRLPDMVYAVILRSPRFGGTLVSFDDSAARAVQGVLDVRQIAVGIAVIASDTWSAMRGRDALTAEWDFANAENRSSAEMEAEYAAALATDGLVARNDGDVAAALSGATATIDVEFHAPFLAHGPLETLNCVVQIADGKVTFWDGAQGPTTTQMTVGGLTGVGPENVAINTLYAGGSFGRRGSYLSDYQNEAAMVAMALNDGRPVHLVWSREDDLRGGNFRPMAKHRIRAGVDAAGKAVGWHSSMANKSILIGSPLEGFLVKDGIDPLSVEGAADTPYAIPNLRVDIRNMVTPITVLWWRAVGHSHSAFAMESAMDMLAEAASRDPVEFRAELFANAPRHLGVLTLAAEKAGWGTPLPAGWARGVAVHKSFGTFVAQVAEVSVTDGRVKVERVVAAVDVGVAVNPDVIRAQVEGAVGYGLGHAMRNEITFEAGEVVQSNFPDYESLRMAEMPKVEVYIVPSTEAPSGIGEPGLPPLAPAVANAIYAATGKRITRLPMIADGIEFA